MLFGDFLSFLIIIMIHFWCQSNQVSRNTPEETFIRFYLKRCTKYNTNQIRRKSGSRQKIQRSKRGHKAESSTKVKVTGELLTFWLMLLLSDSTPSGVSANRLFPDAAIRTRLNIGEGAKWSRCDNRQHST